MRLNKGLLPPAPSIIRRPDLLAEEPNLWNSLPVNILNEQNFKKTKN